MSETNYQFAHGKKIRIAIADDHISVRKGFIQLLKEVENFKIVGEASNGKELLEILPELSPDILLLDIEMPQMSGRETLQKI
ncbi:response regulator transcription factor, partial [Salmonella enterica]|uniref:response regulator transcription factor n=1 Tax=Salmonella enterica TaxID=28901 RepID=UPI0020A57787